jgi:hypothetical protein
VQFVSDNCTANIGVTLVTLAIALLFRDAPHPPRLLFLRLDSRPCFCCAMMSMAVSRHHGHSALKDGPLLRVPESGMQHPQHYADYIQPCYNKHTFHHICCTNLQTNSFPNVILPFIAVVTIYTACANITKICKPARTIRNFLQDYTASFPGRLQSSPP